MHIAIISDTHDNIPNLEKFLNWAKDNKIEAIIHCGDLCAPAFLTKVLAPNFSGQIHLIYGNVGDREKLTAEVKDFPNVKFYGDFGEIELDNKKIAFVHQPEEAKKMAETGKYDLVFYGHNHKPWIQKMRIEADHNQRKSALLVNPGNLAGMFYKATFAIYDTETDKLELKILETL